MSEIFITYARQDRARAEKFVTLLQNHGWTVWWDRQIPAGESFDDVIETALDSSRCVVVLWSLNSTRSDWVKTEAAEGKRRNVLVPVLLDDVKIPLEFRRIEAANLVDWRGNPDHPEARRLVSAVRTVLSSPAVVAEQAPLRARETRARRTSKLITLAAAIVGAVLAAYFARGLWSENTRSRPEDPRVLQWSGRWNHYSARADGGSVIGTIDLRVAGDGVVDGDFTNDNVEKPEAGKLNGRLSSDGGRIEGAWRLLSRPRSGRFEFRLVRGGRAFRGGYSVGETGALANQVNYWNGQRPAAPQTTGSVPTGPRTKLAALLSTLDPGNHVVVVGSFATQERARDEAQKIKGNQPELFLPEFATELYEIWGEGVYKSKNGLWAVYIGGAYSPVAGRRLRQFAIDELGMQDDLYLGFPFFD